MKTSCHCGNITIEVAPPVQVTSCNCSICTRYQALWGYYPPDQVRVEVQADGESVYAWGDRELEFVRCANCGCVTHYRTLPGQPKPKIGVNFRMVLEDSVEGVPVRHFDGKNML